LILSPAELQDTGPWPGVITWPEAPPRREIRLLHAPPEADNLPGDIGFAEAVRVERITRVTSRCYPDRPVRADYR